MIGTEFTGDETTPAGAAAMFELRGGLVLALYPRSELSKDANVPLEGAVALEPPPPDKPVDAVAS